MLRCYNQIYPKFRVLYESQGKTQATIRSEWIQYLERLITDNNAKRHSGAFVHLLFEKGMFIPLLNNRTEKISELWLESLYIIGQSHSLYIPTLKPRNGYIVHPKGKFPTFNVSQDALTKLRQLSQPKLQKLLNFYDKLKASVDDEVVKGLVPMMQKYISSPLS